MMTMCLIFGEEMIRVICVYAPQSEKPDLAFQYHWELETLMVRLKRWMDLRVYMGKMDLRVYMGKMDLGSKIWKAKNVVGILRSERFRCSKYMVKKKRKVTYSSSGNKTEINFALVEKAKSS